MKKSQLLAELQELRHDKAFGILTRPALEIEHRKATNAASIIFLDLDKVHDLNTLLGATAVNLKVKKSLNIRHDDLLLAGRWFSGDELVFVIKVTGNAEAVAERILASLNRNGLSATIAFAPLKGTLESAVKQAQKKVDAAKLKNNRGMIVR